MAALALGVLPAVERLCRLRSTPHSPMRFAILCILMHVLDGCNPVSFGGIGNILPGRLLPNDTPAATSSTGFQAVPTVTPIAPPLPGVMPALRDPGPKVQSEPTTTHEHADVLEPFAERTRHLEALPFQDRDVLGESQVVPAEGLNVLGSESTAASPEEEAPEQLEGSPVAPRSHEPVERADFGYGLASEDGAEEMTLGARRGLNEQDLEKFARWSEEQLEPFLPAVIGQALGVSLHSAARAVDAISGGRLGTAGRQVRGWVDDAVGWAEAQPEVLMWRLQPGDHLRVRGVAGLMALTHHAIYLGDGRIMHFTGGVTDKANATCKVDTLRALYNYGKGSRVRVEVIEHPAEALPRHIIVHRALSRVGETGYNLFSNNCEHMVNWCVSGRTTSQQMERFLADPLGLGKEILDKQAEIGKPLGFGEIAQTLLPPSVLRPFDMLRQQRDAILKRFNPPPKTPDPAPNPLQQVQRWVQERIPHMSPPTPTPAVA